MRVLVFHWAPTRPAAKLRGMTGPSRTQTRARTIGQSLLVAALCTAALCCRPRTPDDASSRSHPDLLPADPAVEVEVLDSGVTYLAERREDERHLVSMSLVVRAGTLAEAADEHGLAHFVEHMAFSGTRHFPKRELREFLGWSGATLNAHSQGLTASDFTLYELKLPGEDPRALERGMLLLADWATGMTFDPVAVDEERRIVLAEKIHGSGVPGRFFQERLSELFSAASGDASRSSVVETETVTRATAEQLRRFHDRWYQPQNLGVVVVGDFEPRAMRERVVSHFGDLPRPARPNVPPRFEARLTHDEHLATILQPDAPLDLFAVVLRQGARGFQTRADHRTRLLDRLVASMIQQRLEVSSFDPESLLAVPRAKASHDLGATALLLIAATTKAGPLTPVSRDVLLELERLRRHQFLGSELFPARASLLSQLQRSRRYLSSTGVPERTLDLAAHFIHGAAVVSPSDQKELDREVLESLTVEAVNEHVVTWLHGSERHLLLLGSDPEMLPSEQELLAVSAAVRAAEPEPYEPEPVPEELMASPPSPVAIAREERLVEIDTWVWTLSNGARVLFKPMGSEPGQVELVAFSPGGTSRSPDLSAASARLSIELIDHLGFGDHSAREVNTLLSRRNASVSAWITGYEEGLRASSSMALVPMFQAIHQRLAAPRPDARELEAFKVLSSKALAMTNLDASEVFSSEMERSVWAGDPAHAPLTPAAIAQLELDAALGFYRERFGDVGDFTFVIVGDVRKPDLQRLVEQYLATLPGSDRKDAVTEPGAQRRGGITRIRVHRGGIKKASVSLWFHGRGPLPRYARQELDALQYYLHLRVLEVLRERLGGIYSVNVWKELDEPPHRGYRMGLSFDCAPEQAESLKEAALHVIEEVKQREAAPEDVAELKAQRATRARLALRDSKYWLDELVNAHRRGHDPRSIPAIWQADVGLSGQELRRSARRYLQSQQYVDAILLPRGAPASR